MQQQYLFNHPFTVKEPIHILLVEENEGDILLTTEALYELDEKIVIKVLTDGWEAIQYLEDDSKHNRILPHLVLLDINLTKINGYEVLKYIKTNPLIQHIPVIILTTSSSEDVVIECYRQHANAYITKPVDVDDFAQLIKSIQNFWLKKVQLPGKIHH